MCLPHACFDPLRYEQLSAAVNVSKLVLCVSVMLQSACLHACPVCTLWNMQTITGLKEDLSGPRTVPKVLEGGKKKVRLPEEPAPEQDASSSQVGEADASSSGRNEHAAEARVFGDGGAASTSGHGQLASARGGKKAAEKDGGGAGGDSEESGSEEDEDDSDEDSSSDGEEGQDGKDGPVDKDAEKAARKVRLAVRH